MTDGNKASNKTRLLSNRSGKARAANGKGNSNKEGSCMRKLSAILTRILFALHAGIAIWRVSIDYPQHYLYFLSIGLVCLLFEMVFTVVIRHGREYKWFCPSVLFYLMSVVPCLWFLELSRLEQVRSIAVQSGICNSSIGTLNASIGELPLGYLSNVTSSNRTKRDSNRIDNISHILKIQYNQSTLKKRPKRESSPEKRKKRKRKGDRRKKQKDIFSEDGSGMIPLGITANETTVSATTANVQSSGSITVNGHGWITSKIPDENPTTTHLAVDSTKTTSSLVNENSIDNLGQKIKNGLTTLEQQTLDIITKSKEEVGQFVIRLTKSVDNSTWILLLHQVLLFVLVIGRWLLPKGDITRDQLSQLLLVFIGVGADILEFVTETIDSDEVDATSCSDTLHYVIYGVWSWSLIQFTLVLTASKSRKTRVGFASEEPITASATGCCAGSLFSSADLWGILVTLFLQDAPFLATRLYILIVHNLKHQMMIFFTGKNALVVILQIYRIIVLKIEQKHKEKDKVNDTEMQPLRGTLIQLAKQARMMSISEDDTVTPDDIRDATFKSQRDGSVVVKIHLEGEETLKRKRKSMARNV